MGAIKNQRATWLDECCGITDFLNFFTDNRIFSTDFEKFVTNSLILYKAHYQLHSLLSNLVAGQPSFSIYPQLPLLMINSPLMSPQKKKQARLACFLL